MLLHSSSQQPAEPLIGNVVALASKSQQRKVLRQYSTGSGVCQTLFSRCMLYNETKLSFRRIIFQNLENPK